MVTVAAAGIDTWSPCWWLEPHSPAARHLQALCSRGGLYPDAINGHRVGYVGTGLLWAEGHPSDDGLGRPADLPAAHDQLVAALLEAGVPVPVGRRGEDLYGERHSGVSGIRRLDSTVDLRTESPAEGFALMAGIAAVATSLPRSQANVWWAPSGRRRVQTVALHGHRGGKLLGRIYDKGAESGSAAPGRHLRPEDQRRWPKGSRRDVDELTGHYVREKFHQRFTPLWRASKGVTVAGAVVLAEKLAELVQADELTPRVAESLAGYILLDSFGASAVPGRTARRRRAQLREHGLVLADGVLQEVEVDLGAALEQALDCADWGPGV